MEFVWLRVVWIKFVSEFHPTTFYLHCLCSALAVVATLIEIRVCCFLSEVRAQALSLSHEIGLLLIG